jgi:hypothetical protein
VDFDHVVPHLGRAAAIAGWRAGCGTLDAPVT